VSGSRAYTAADILAGSGETVITVKEGNNTARILMTVSGGYAAKAITAFNITSPVSAAGAVNEAAKTVRIAVPYV
jgi:hypothetical protein